MARSHVIAGLLLAACCIGAKPVPERELIDYAKSVDVQRLDATLPSQPLAEWLRTARIGEVEWRVTNCCNCDLADRNLCVRFRFEQGGASGMGMLRVGTRRDGISGAPSLQTLEVPPLTGGKERLSDLPRLVADQTKVVAFGKTIDVAKLDPSLPSMPLDQWLRNGPAHLEKVEWRISDCDLKSAGETPGGDPLCVKFVFHRGAVSGYGIVTVGTTRMGLVQPPRFEYAMAAKNVLTGFATASKLSDLPGLVSSK